MYAFNGNHLNILIITDRLIIKDCYTLEEAQNFIDVLLEKAPIVYQCYFLLAI